jgi:hypothetical protein
VNGEAIFWPTGDDAGRSGMAINLYLSMLPESLVASMLPPEEFGAYLAVGTEKRSRGPAIYFELSRSLKSEYFDLSDVEKRCVPHPNGDPKHSVYLSIYRVLEHVPMSAIKDLFLVTRDGRVLRLTASDKMPSSPQKYHLYQEIGPVHPSIVSTLDPKAFSAFITDPKSSIQVPRILFMDLRLGELADNPETGNIRDLPYSQIEHLRGCLIQLRKAPGKHTKTVDRMHPVDLPFRTVQTGLFLGDREQCRYYPFPSSADLQTKYYEWWRSATM